MSRPKFNLGDYLRATPVSDSDTEQIERVPLDLIDPDPTNFYSLEGLDELAANVETVGLLDPLRVRPSDGGRYTVVSGHRRRAACMLIRDGGSPMFSSGVPCIVETGETSAAMRELRLIFANSATRVMTSAEQSRQAERVTELLYQLKEEGVEFPGRMRDHVAEACRITSSKLARLHAIRGNLVPSLLERYDAGELNEAVAYRISQERPALQYSLNSRLGADVGNLTEQSCGQIFSKLRSEVTTPKAEPAAKPEPAPVPESDTKQEGRQLRKYLEELAKDDYTFWHCLEETADMIIQRSFDVSVAGPACRRDNIDQLRRDMRTCGYGSVGCDWTGSHKGMSIGPDVASHVERSWTEVYDALAAMAITRYKEALPKLVRAVKLEADNDRLRKKLEAVFNPNTSEAPAPAWRPGDPPRPGRYLCKIDMGDGGCHEQQCEYGDGGWTVYGRPIETVGFEVRSWWPLPGKYDFLPAGEADADEDEEEEEDE